MNYIKYILIGVGLLPFILFAQQTYLFDATYLEPINDSISLYEIKMANFENSYQNFLYYEVEGETFDYSTNSSREKIVGTYDERGYSFYHFNNDNYLERLDRNIFNGSLNRVIDGDTYWMNILVPTSQGRFKTTRLKVRLYNCDAYEKTTMTLYNKDLKRRETDQEHDQRLVKAKLAKKYAEHLLTTIPFTIVYKHKYRNSRIVATIMFNTGKTMKQYLQEADLLTGKYETF